MASFTFTLARQDLARHKLRTLFSALSVTLGTAVILAADYTGSAIRRAGESLGESGTVPFVGEFLNTGLGLMGLVILLVASFLIFNAFAMSVTQRQQQIGALRALGMTRRQIGQLVLVEALLLGGLGALAGALLGPLLGQGILYLLSTAANIAHGQGEVSAATLLLAIGVGLGVTLLAAAIPAWRALRISPLAALRVTTDEAPPWSRRRLLRVSGIGLLLTLPPLLYLLVDPPGARLLTPPWDMVLTGLFTTGWLAGWALLLPLILRGTHAVVLRLSHRALPRLMADNLVRAQGRVALTILTLSLALLMIVTVTGITSFIFDGIIKQVFARTGRAWIVMAAPFSDTVTVDWGVLSTWDLNTMNLSPEFVSELEAVNQGQANWLHTPQAFIPELSIMPGMPSQLVDIGAVRAVNLFTFSEGSWETAEPLMQNGCGLLLIPRIAARLDAGVGDTVTVTGANGPVRCVVAGLGSNQMMMGVPMISQAAAADFAVDAVRPFGTLIQPLPGTDIDQLLADTQRLLAGHPDYTLLTLDDFVTDTENMVDTLQVMLNGMLLLAMVAAALGVINTTLSSIIERRAELGLLRAVGGTRRQVTAVVMGEAALLGLVGGAVGALAGLGVVTIFVLASGGNLYGISDLDLWQGLRQSLPVAGASALVGLLAAPLITTVAAYWPAAYFLQGTAINTLKPEYPVQRERGEARAGISRLFTSSAILSLAWSNLVQGRLRALFSAVGVVLGVSMIVAGDVAQAGLRQGVQATAGSQDAATWLVDNFETGMQIVGTVILAAAGFLIFNAFLMAVTQRQQQIGALRALGMTRRQVVQTVLLEAAVIGLLGSLAGILLGPLLGNAILAALRQIGMKTATGEATWSSYLLAAGMGVGMALLAVWLPARQAARVSPLVALRGQTQAAAFTQSRLRRLALAGLTLLLALALLILLAPPARWAEPQLNLQLGLALPAFWTAGWLLLLPALVGRLSRWSRRPLSALLGNTGRLMADNLGRDRGRVTLTLLTFVVSLGIITSLTAMLMFNNKILFTYMAREALAQEGWFVFPFDQNRGALVVDQLASTLSPAVVADFYQATEGRAEIGRQYLVIAPEVSSLFAGFPSTITDLNILQTPGSFTFYEGDWATARPVMEAGCGLLIPPDVAGRTQLGIGDSITLTAVTYPIECRVAGIGSGGIYPATFLSPAALPAFNNPAPTTLNIIPHLGIDRSALQDDLQAAADKHIGEAWLTTTRDSHEAINQSSEAGVVMMDAMLLLAMVAAVMGVINNTLMSVMERRQELGLLRAVGSTRRQVRALVMGEAVLLGLVGGLVGLLVGLGNGLIFVFAYGGKSFGVVDLPLAEAAAQTLRPALVTGLLGLALAPLLSAAAAYFPARQLVQGSALVTLSPEQPAVTGGLPQQAGRLWRWGTLQTRFVLGTAVLLLLTLWGLNTFIVRHTGRFMDKQVVQAGEAMVSLMTSFIEADLPADATDLTADTLPTDQFGPEALLRLSTLFDDTAALGLVNFALTNRENNVLHGLNPRQAGTRYPQPGAAALQSQIETTPSGRRLLVVRPVQNGQAAAVGYVHLTASLEEADALLQTLARILWGVGGAIALLGVVASWLLTLPHTRLARRLAAQTRQVGQGELTPLVLQSPTWWRRHFSLRTQLTATLVAILALLVLALQLVTLPIQRRQIEATLTESMQVSVEWISDGLSAMAGTLPAGFNSTSLTTLAQQTDLTRLQRVSEQTRSDDIAYTALLEQDGSVQFSDQLSLVGEILEPVRTAQIQKRTWRGEPVWLISAPLTQGERGAPFGAIQVAVRQQSLDTFTAETRTLFQFTGVIAVLAGVLLAQVIGGAVTAPVREMASGSRQVGQGDLSVQFRVDSRDELAQLAGAFNEMVGGLREREWLRDMFGRFVSQEVAEAIRTGQVQLDGENRVVSVLFCDIRDFTARSERSTPAEMVALLNDYLPLVVAAAQQHDGVVNKFGGDSTLIIYGAPRKLAESAYHAVLTALEMRDHLALLNEKLVAQGEEPIRIGVGINTGVALAGAVGPPARQEYTVIGDTVNLASRIEALNKQFPQHDILISHDTCEALGLRRTAFELVDLGEQAIRGKQAAVRVWGVVAAKS